MGREGKGDERWVDRTRSAVSPYPEPCQPLETGRRGRLQPLGLILQGAGKPTAPSSLRGSRVCSALGRIKPFLPCSCWCQVTLCYIPL